MTDQKRRIGILRLLDCAPVIIAGEFGFFTDAGIDATISIEPSWANIADKLAYGLLDAAVILGPLALAMTLGLRGRPTALRLAATISRDGNAIVLAPDLAQSADLAAANGLRFAVVHAYSTHDLLLRDWLAARGVMPETVTIITLPPAAMPAALASGAIAGFCAGAPWGAVAAREGIGTIVATSATIAPGHPEKLLVIRADVADRNPMLAAALRHAIGAATALCQMPDRRAALAALLAQPGNLDLPADILAEALVPLPGNPVFMTGTALRPTPRDLLWSTDRLQRAGSLSGIDALTAKTILLTPADLPTEG
ncbi:MAG: CmpA/NrtA family ABC transporter substrate-binding protein [Acidiphilium sp.]|nr:CmpA/NrtA family ABC transporter substrate-binding protein [Acidiphilium sp.]MDD4936707.1 CmpA/NrtA family ABC transporter substrate-binding protein [Acidiphilium sp.]